MSFYCYYNIARLSRTGSLLAILHLFSKTDHLMGYKISFPSDLTSAGQYFTFAGRKTGKRSIVASTDFCTPQRNIKPKKRLNGLKTQNVI
jgi:hypothetical protein